jgi:hypothetical protein
MLNIVISGRGRGSCQVGKEGIIDIFNILEEGLMHTPDEGAFPSFLESRAIGVGTRGGRGSSNMALGGAGLRNKRAVPDGRIVVVFGGMHLFTDITDLGIKPSLPGGIRRSGIGG